LPLRRAHVLPFCLCWASFLALVQFAGSAVATTVLCPNGITAEVLTAEEIAQYWLEESGGRVFVVHPALGKLELLTGPSDPRLPRDDVDTFQPYDLDTVSRALSDMHGVQPRLEVTLFLLPAPPATELGSFATGNVVVLSPGFGPLAPTSVAYTVTHEMGHVLTWAYMDRLPSRWHSYLHQRGLDALEGTVEGPHADRVREILAEDIRFLFGGSLATASGTIENHDLVTPDLVPGLRPLLASFFQGVPLLTVDRYPSRAVPNPCNPATTIQMQLPAGIPVATMAELMIYDLQGRLVTRLTTVDRLADLVRVAWNGRDGSGRAAASGQYCYLLRYGEFLSRGTVILVR